MTYLPLLLSGGGFFQGTRAGVAVLQFGFVGAYQLDVELDLGDRTGHTEARAVNGLLYLVGFHHQLVAGSKGEVVVGVLVTGQVDLGSQVLVAGRLHEIVDVCRTTTVTAEQIEQALGGAFRRAAIAGGDDGLGEIAAVRIGLDATAQVVIALRLVKVGISAVGIGMPDVDDGVGNRVALGIGHPTLDQHGLGSGVGTVVHPRKAFAQRRAGNEQRALDGARGAARQAGGLVLGIHADGQVLVHTQTGRQQCCLVVLAQLAYIIDRGPEFLRSHVEVLDQLEDIAHEAVNDLLQASIATFGVQARYLVQQFFYFFGMHGLDGHDFFLVLVLVWITSLELAISSGGGATLSAGTRGSALAQRSSSWMDEGWRHSGATLMSM